MSAKIPEKKHFLFIFLKSTTCYVRIEIFFWFKRTPASTLIRYYGYRHNCRTCRRANVYNGSSYPVTEIGKSKGCNYVYFIKHLVWLLYFEPVKIEEIKGLYIRNAMFKQI